MEPVASSRGRGAQGGGAGGLRSKFFVGGGPACGPPPLPLRLTNSSAGLIEPQTDTRPQSDDGDELSEAEVSCRPSARGCGQQQGGQGGEAGGAELSAR